MANSSRTTWFLGLQSTLRFPRYSMAPLPKLVTFRKANIGHFETAPSATPKGHGVAAVHQRSGAIRSDPVVGILAPKSIMAARDYLPGHRSVPLLSQPGTGRMPSPVVDFSRAVSRNRLGMPQKNAMVAIGVGKRVGFPAGQAPRLPPLFDASGPASTAQAQFAPIGSSPQTQGVAVPTTGTPMRRNSHREHPPISQERLPAGNVPHPVNESLIDRAVLEPPDLGISEQYVGQQQRPPSASTLHIDGAALGRWAVQHLARTLGKPTTGMTGVDPRVTSPRSRLQPF